MNLDADVRADHSDPWQALSAAKMYSKRDHHFKSENCLPMFSREN
jgi:hypothetical protein